MTCGNCTTEEIKENKWSEFKIAIPIALIFIGLFFVLQKLGILNLIDTTEVSYGTAFIIGLVASVSSCMAVVGGLVLSMSANFAKMGDKVRPQALFHIGRIVSFAVLGGVIGVLGATFQISNTGTFILSLAVAIVLLILGLNLLDIFPWIKKIQPTLPVFVREKVHGVKNLNHTLTPLLVGVATFFLPCGFTQSMQLYALSTGSFLTGSLTMLSFALGTLPVLLVLSFTSVGIHKKAQSRIFLKTAGIIVIFFALFSITNSLSLVGIKLPTFTKTEITNISSSNVSIVEGVQIIELVAKGGYTPEHSTAKSGLPTVIRFITNGIYDCSSIVRISSLKINKSLPQTGVTDIDIGKPAVGNLDGSCGMGMYPFYIEFI